MFQEDHWKEEVQSGLKTSALSLVQPTCHSRLLVITGIPNYLDQSTVKQAITKVCNRYGGLDRNEVFVPEIKQRVSTSEGDGKDQSAATSSTCKETLSVSYNLFTYFIDGF